MGKGNWSADWFHYISIALKLTYNRLLIQRYAQFWFFRWGSGNSFATTICIYFFNKNVSHLILFELIKFHCLVALTSWDIGQSAYCNCLLTTLWRHKFQNFKKSIQSSRFYTWPKSQDKNMNISRMERGFRWNKKHFSSFLKDFQLRKIFSDLRSRL